MSSGGGSIRDYCYWMPVDDTLIRYNIQNSAFRLKVRNVPKSLVMLSVCDDENVCDLLMINVLSPTASRVSILRSHDCSWDYEFSMVPQRSEVVWTLQKVYHTLKIGCEDEHVMTAQFNDSTDEQCKTWADQYSAISLRDPDTASIAYCVTLGK